MLVELFVKDFAIIEQCRLNFENGFTVLTGETGAGKSLIVDAIEIVLGGRADLNLIRTGASKTDISATFDVANNADIALLTNEYGIDIEDGTLILSRELNNSGRSVSRINGKQTPNSVVKIISEKLIDIHGQHEHQILIKANSHIDYLDAFIGKPAKEHIVTISNLYDELAKLRKSYELLQKNTREREQMIDLYSFQVKEIETASLSPNEDTELEIELKRLANIEKLSETAAIVKDRLLDGESPAFDAAAVAHRALKDAVQIDPSLQPAFESLETIMASIDEAVLVVSNYKDALEFNPARLEEIGSRLDEIHKLKRKYGNTISEIIEYGNSTKVKLDELIAGETRSEELEANIQKTQIKLNTECDKLSTLRKVHSTAFAKAVKENIQPLAMEKADFSVNIQPKSISKNGSDDVEFLFTPNLGEQTKPLVKIASGGEISRLMLGIKCALTGKIGAPTIIFDEIDSGLGGKAANSVGKKIAELARNNQILCVTHLPQIAGRANHQITIGKEEHDERTRMRAVVVINEERVNEIARMISGDLTETGIAHARQILKEND